MRLFPVLEAGGDKVYVESVLNEKLCDETKARVAFLLVAELYAHGDDGYAWSLS